MNDCLIVYLHIKNLLVILSNRLKWNVEKKGQRTHEEGSPKDSQIAFLHKNNASLPEP